jgi:hypothetical protein
MNHERAAQALAPREHEKVNPQNHLFSQHFHILPDLF